MGNLRSLQQQILGLQRRVQEIEEQAAKASELPDLSVVFCFFLVPGTVCLSSVQAWLYSPLRWH